MTDILAAVRDRVLRDRAQKIADRRQDSVLPPNVLSFVILTNAPAAVEPAAGGEWRLSVGDRESGQTVLLMDEATAERIVRELRARHESQVA